MQPTKDTSGVWFTCVFIPLSISLFAIFSTLAPSSTQSQTVAGIPQFLCLWIGLAITMIITIIATALSLKFNDDGNFELSSTSSETPEDTQVSNQTSAGGSE